MFVLELDTLDVPPLTPTSKEVLSQAVKASFAGFTQERISLHLPQGTVCEDLTINIGTKAFIEVIGTCLYICTSRSYAVVGVGGEPLAGLVAG